MVLSNQNVIIGIDCGATKVLVQSAMVDSETGMVSPGEFQLEKAYAKHSSWNLNFIPIHLDIQRQEFLEGTINLTEPEMDQGDVMVETIREVFLNPSVTPFLKDRTKEGFKKYLALCFPGIKNEHGIVIMANGPRAPNLYSRIGIDEAYNDSDCCVLGEWKSTIGQLQQCENAIYIGGGTGIADGIILNGDLIDFNIRDDVIRSWELIMEDGHSVESLLSPKGMIDQWNFSHVEKISTLSELSEKNDATIIFEKATEAFSCLIQDRISFFQANNSEIEKIVIGQRLGIFMSESALGTMIESTTTIPIVYSKDRRTAALGAAWKKACS